MAAVTADELYASVSALPILSPHTHVDAGWLCRDEMPEVAELLVEPDHYVHRLLHAAGEPPARGRALWQALCRNWSVFSGTNSRLWLELQLDRLFGIPAGTLGPETAEETYELIASQMARPLEWFGRFGIELLATTDAGLAPLEDHRSLQDRGVPVVPTLRPDNLLDPSAAGWRADVAALSQLHDVDCSTWSGLVEGLRRERARFAEAGALATDHGPATAETLVLGEAESERLFRRVVDAAEPAAADAAALGALLLTTMAELACEDGLAMQLHPGVFRNHDGPGFVARGPDIGADFPVPAEFTRPLRPLLERFGNSPSLRLVVYSVDEFAYARELAPLASYYPALRLGAPWWFLDAPLAMGRWLSQVSEVAGLSRLAGFVDDARGLCSIPARHEVARRGVCEFLATLVDRGRLAHHEAEAAAVAFAYGQPKATFGL